MKRWMTTDPSPEQPATRERMDNYNKIDRSAEQPTTQLYEAIREGDQYAFSRYYETSLDRLVTLVTRITKDSEEARNIAQDTLIKLWEQREQIDPTQSVDGFVSRTAWNSALNYLKRQRVHNRYCNEQLLVSNEEDLCADEKLVTRETAQRIESVICNLPPQRRKVFELSRNDGLSRNEIADRLDISPSTVKNHLTLALDEIRKALFSF